jgi:hypothetical protein
MYIIVDTKTLLALQINVTREQAVNSNMLFMNNEDYSNVVVGMKFDKLFNSFSHLTTEEIRQTRNELLVETDWRATVDYPNLDQGAWLEYRQALRDIPQDYPEMVAVVFPTKPIG